MSRTRRSFTTEYKVEAAHRVIDSGRTITEVARELGVNEGLLGRWVAEPPANKAGGFASSQGVSALRVCRGRRGLVEGV
jgi:transposase-like protein